MISSQSDEIYPTVNFRYKVMSFQFTLGVSEAEARSADNQGELKPMYVF